MLISLENVSFTYLNNTSLAVNALQNIDLNIGVGERVAIVGASGSGKSTLAQLMAGLLFPTSGAMRIDGRTVATPAQADMIRQRTGLVFQFPEAQLFAETVAADIAFGPRNLGLPEHEIDKRVGDALRAVGMDHERFAWRSPFSLSGGEQRLVAIAGVVAMHPDIIMFDEPTGDLDARSRASIIALLDDMNKQGTATVIITHDISEAVELSERILVLDKGRLVVDGPVAGVLVDSNALASLQPATIPTIELIAVLQERGITFECASYALSAAADSIAHALKERRCR